MNTSPGVDEAHVALHQPDAGERVEAAKAAAVPQIYVNGFVTSMSSSDVMCALERNGEPVAMLNMSFTMAKTFSLALGTLIANLEDRTGRTMLTTNEIEKAVAATEGGAS